MAEETFDQDYYQKLYEKTMELREILKNLKEEIEIFERRKEKIRGSSIEKEELPLIEKAIMRNELMIEAVELLISNIDSILKEAMPVI
jgi:cell division septum initiation protein DivIVA